MYERHQPRKKRIGKFRALNRYGVYRDHPTGEVFEERIARRSMMAVQRGDIEFLCEVMPELVPGSYSLPPGWLSPTPRPTEAPEGVSFVRR